MVRKIAWTLRAQSDLKDIHEFISKDSTRYAQIQIEAIFDTVATLAAFSGMGHVIPEFPDSPYLEISEGIYRILYRFNEETDQIIIMSIVHGRKKLDRPNG